MEESFIKLNRKLFEHWIYPHNVKMSPFEAWIELIRLANYSCVQKYIQSKLVLIPRGSFDTTITQLSNIFHWDRRSVEKFLKLLETDGMIERTKISNSLKACTILKINNYNKYQILCDEICKSSYKTKCNYMYCQKPCTEEVKRFTKPTLEEVRAYCVERNNGIEAESFINFYESKGWKIGKTPMKDWRAAVRTWEAKRKPKQEQTIITQDDDFYMRLSRK